MFLNVIFAREKKYELKKFIYKVTIFACLNLVKILIWQRIKKIHYRTIKKNGYSM